MNQKSYKNDSRVQAHHYDKVLSVKHMTPIILDNDDLKEASIKTEDVSIIQQVEEEYNYIMIPADVKIAKNHAIARSVQKPIKQKDYYLQALQNFKQNTEKYNKMTPQQQEGNELPVKPDENTFCIDECPCCSYQINRKPIALCDSTLELSFLGSGFPLFFNYIQWCFILMLFYFVICGIFDLWSNINGSFCQDTTVQKSASCKLLWTNMISLANKMDSEKNIKIQNFLNTFITFFMMFLLMLFRRYQRKMDADIDSEFCSPADFTIMVRNIPKNLKINYEEELIKLFTHHSVPGKIIKPTSVSLIYQIDSIDYLIQALEQSLQRKQAYLEEKGIKALKGEYSIELDDMRSEIKSILSRILHMIDRIKEMPEFFAGYAFISFNTETEKNLVLQNNTHFRVEKFYNLYNENQWKHQEPIESDLLFNGYKIMIAQAFEPLDVNWDSFYQTGLERLKGRIKSGIYTVILALMSFGILMGLTYYQDFYIDNATADANLSKDEEQMIQYMSVGISFTIFILNQVAVETITGLVDLELHVCNSNKNISSATKLCWISFLNSALIDFLITVFYSKNYFGTGGFIYTQTIVFFQNMFMNPLINIISYDYWMNRLAVEETVKEIQTNQCFATQQEINSMFEEPEYQVSDRYADIIQTMWVTFLYAPLVPIVLPFSLINLIFTYWTEKYTLIRRSSVKEVLSQRVSIEMIELIEFIIIFYALGNFVFEYQIFGKWDTQSIIQVAAGFIYSLLPMQTINEKIWQFNDQEEEETWEESIQENKFEVDYCQQNPIYIHEKNARQALNSLDEEDRLLILQKRERQTPFTGQDI